jgi:G8 domain
MIISKLCVVALVASTALAGCSNPNSVTTQTGASDSTQTEFARAQSETTTDALGTAVEFQPERARVPGNSAPPRAPTRSLVKKLWSEATSWPAGNVPGITDAVVIPSGTTITLDRSVAVKNLTVLGTLEFADQNLNLDADWIVVQGPGATLEIGTETNRFTKKAVITLTAKDTAESVMGMGTRGILAMDGATIRMFGQGPTTPWVKLNGHLATNSSDLSVETAVNWAAGDEIIVTSTDFFPNFAWGQPRPLQTTRSSIAQVVDPRRFTLTTPVGKARWGTLQTFDNGSLTIDERAEVANLTRPIVIQGADDTLWRTQGFGAHVMAMRGSVLKLDSVQMRRVGQAGKVGRYPLHWHLTGYDATGAALPDTAGNFVKNASISQSSNRCVTIHGSNAISIQNNVCYDILGHAIFFEDAVERRNIVEGNLIAGVRNPTVANALLASENPNVNAASSGVWITHPDNIVRNNSVSDLEGHGYWFAFPEKPSGASKLVKTTPNRAYLGAVENNSAHSLRLVGHFLDEPAFNDAGNVGPVSYIPTSPDGDLDSPWGRIKPFEIKGTTVWKQRSLDIGGGNTMWNRAYGLRVTGSKLSSFTGKALAGAVGDCQITGNNLVGSTANIDKSGDILIAAVGAATYHGECSIVGNTFVNLPLVIGSPSGAHSTDDYYLKPVDKTLQANYGNRLINAHPGYRTVPKNLTGPGWALSGALWDPQGLWGNPGSYWVLDIPFLTFGNNCTALEPGNGRTCLMPYYGIANFVADSNYGAHSANTEYLQHMRVRCTRLEPGAGGAFFEVLAIPATFPLPNMRHCALTKGSEVLLEFPDLSQGHASVEFSVTNLTLPDDTSLLAVKFGGSAKPRVTFGQGALSEFASLAALKGQVSAGFWHDPISGLVWIKLTSGQSTVTPSLYNERILKIAVR